MAETTLQLGFVPKERGNYTSGTNYYKDNVVQYNGSSYIADPVGWSEDHPTDTYVTIAPTDASGNLNAGWKVFASGNNTFTTGEKVDNVGIDSEPTAGSENLVKSSGVALNGIDNNHVIKRKFFLTNTGGYISKSNGTVQPYENAVYSDYIKCIPGQLVKFYLQADSSMGVAFYNKNKVFVSGINVVVSSNPSNVTIPENTYFLRASSRTSVMQPFVQFVDNESLDDIKETLPNSIWIKNPDMTTDTSYYIQPCGSDGFNVRRIDVYNIIKDIKLIGFDSTKKITFDVLWNTTTGVFRIRLIQYNTLTSSWETIFDYSDNSYIRTIYNFGIDATVGSKRVVATFDFEGRNYSSLVFNGGGGAVGSYEYVFSPCCFIEDNNTVYSAGDGIIINNNNVISIDPENVPVPEEIYDGDGEVATYSVLSSAFSISGYINASGIYRSHATNQCTNFLPCNEGQIYKMSLRLYNRIYVAFYTSNEESSYINNSSFTSYEDYNYITVPQGAKYMRLSNAPTFTNPSAILQNPTNVGLKALTEDVRKIKNSDYPSNTPIILSPMAKLPCVSFQFDDNYLEGDSRLVELFESYGKTCAFAFIANDNNINNVGKKYREFQKRGFQIMNHFVTGLSITAQNFTEQQARDNIYYAKRNLNKIGIVCNGFVCPSSTIEESYKYLLKIFHSYAFTTSVPNYDATINGTTADRCDLHRETLQGNTTLSQLESFIDNCITNNQIITFYGHSLDLVEGGDETVFSIAKIRALIEYCITKEQAGLLYFGNTDDCVKYFFDL